eukprot:SM000060S19611  [mRNA]  locus=s60:177567:178109:+ [translate_table: standard]
MSARGRSLSLVQAATSVLYVVSSGKCPHSRISAYSCRRNTLVATREECEMLIQDGEGAWKEGPAHS